MSPCLYSVRASYNEIGGFDSGDVLDHQGDVILCLAAGIALNIKEVHAYHLTTDAHILNEKSWLPRNIQEKGECCELLIGSLQ